MDHGSTEWKDGLLEVILTMNTQIHSTIGCAPAELLFRQRSSYIDWLNSQARKDLSIGIEQEDPTMGPIFESELHELGSEALLDLQLRQQELERELNSELSSGSEREQSEIKSSSSILSESQSSGVGPGPEFQLNLELSSGGHLIL
ncbi:hypothetical protein VE03_09936 [Pseudogymnoascus sp. 23342-1-I1]|nr:hypothetical protein VE03_09936 [Pseudogymnoascus sp. 23342-1-I1]